MRQRRRTDVGNGRAGAVAAPASAPRVRAHLGEERFDILATAAAGAAAALVGAGERFRGVFRLPPAAARGSLPTLQPEAEGGANDSFVDGLLEKENLTNVEIIRTPDPDLTNQVSIANFTENLEAINYPQCGVSFSIKNFGFMFAAVNYYFYGNFSFLCFNTFFCKKCDNVV